MDVVLDSVIARFLEILGSNLDQVGDFHLCEREQRCQWKASFSGRPNIGD